ncbi:MAG: hypothetical protein QM719_10530 [Thermomonas sp.]
MRESMGLACLLLAASTVAFAAEPPAIPEKVDPKRYEEVPEPWRDYLLQARAAERIGDPLQRCLAFPDLPGNHWPAGHAAAHCRYHFAHKAPSLAEIAAMLDGGKVAELEALVDASQQRHFSDRDFGEDIHQIFDRALFDASPESDRVTAKWLELAPGSAYANLARGQFLVSSAWDARGGKYASETPRASLQRMSELAGEAIPYLEKSLQIDPRLMPAYTVLINLGMMDSREDVEENAFERAKKIDPACVELARMRMNALEPRWGGSYEQMLSYANELKQYVPGRPQLAMYIEKPFSDRGDVLVDDDEYTKATLDVLQAAVAIGGDEDAFRDAADVAFHATDVEKDRWKGVSYLLQETRFRDTNAWGNRSIGWALVLTEPEWSLRYSLRSIELDPGNAKAHSIAGAGYSNMHLLPEAEQQYGIAMEDPNQRHYSLREVAQMWFFGDRPDHARMAKAKPYIDRLLREYPDDGRGWILDLRRRMFINEPLDVAMIEATLKKVDRSDEWQADQADFLEGAIRKMQASLQKPKH